MPRAGRCRAAGSPAGLTGASAGAVRLPFCMSSSHSALHSCFLHPRATKVIPHLATTLHCPQQVYPHPAADCSPCPSLG